ncbi:MAG: hypothetical protein IJD48_02310 [Clostridia bacterium]|nr:hypothetical protein [Clostridia bacterium]
MLKIGTDGFRGIIGEEFTKENVVKIAQCTCNIIKKLKFKKQVVVGYDNRFMAEFYASWVSEVLVANGISVLLTDTSVPSPLVSFATKQLDNQIGLMITASHNPYTYSGLKIFSREGKALEKDVENLYKKLLPKVKKVKTIDFDEALKQGKITMFNYTKEYVKSIVKLLKIKKDFKSKVAFNVLNGSSLGVIEELKKQLKLDKLKLYETQRDVSFKLASPIPDQETLKDFRQEVINQKYDFAFATDGDGDRLAVIDDKGEFHDGNILCPLIYYFAYTQKNQTGAFIKNCAFSHIADKMCERLGVKLIQTPVGFKHITKQFVENNAVIGAEPAGCEVANHVYTKDGTVVFALILEIVEFYQKPLSQIINDFKNFLQYDSKYIECSLKIKDRSVVIDRLQKQDIKFSKKIATKLTLDGFKYIFEDGSWALIRLSGTENLIRIVIEQATQKELDKILKEVKNFVLKV